MSTDLVYPLPELACAGEWEIHDLEHGGHVIRASRILAAPLRATVFARAIRAHEMAHVQFSPEEVDHQKLGIQRSTLLAVEDARVNELAARKGLGIIRDLDDPTLCPPDPQRDLRAGTLWLVASHATRGFARTQAAIFAAGDHGRLACWLARQAIEMLTAVADLPFEMTVAAARMLDAHLGPEPASWAGFGTVCTHRPASTHGRPGARPGPAGRHDERWGALERIEEPPRPIALRRAGRRGTGRATDEGAILCAPYRLLLDGRIFAHRRPRHGGSVLIDASGSMSWTEAKLAALLDAAPAALVACYAGSPEGRGVIRLLARDGWRVAATSLAAPGARGGNVIDGPALRWLARQRPPRVWVSDGHVTGVGDRTVERLTREAQEICARAHIVRVPDAAGALALLCA